MGIFDRIKTFFSKIFRKKTTDSTVLDSPTLETMKKEVEKDLPTEPIPEFKTVEEKRDLPGVDVEKGLDKIDSIAKQYKPAGPLKQELDKGGLATLRDIDVSGSHQADYFKFIKTKLGVDDERLIFDIIKYRKTLLFHRIVTEVHLLNSRNEEIGTLKVQGLGIEHWELLKDYWVKKQFSGSNPKGDIKSGHNTEYNHFQNRVNTLGGVVYNVNMTPTDDMVVSKVQYEYTI